MAYIQASGGGAKPIQISKLMANGVKSSGNSGYYTITTDFYLDVSNYKSFYFEKITLLSASGTPSVTLYDDNNTAIYTATSNVTTPQTINIANVSILHIKLTVWAYPDANRYAMIENITIS